MTQPLNTSYFRQLPVLSKPYAGTEILAASRALGGGLYQTGQLTLDDIVGFSTNTNNDPFYYGADNTGRTDSYAAWFEAITAGIAAAQTNGGVVYIRPTPGTYLLNWNGSTGYSVQSNIPLTGLNQRGIFVFNDPTVKLVVLDLTGVKLTQGGVDWTQWATMFFFIGCRYIVIKGELDYVNLPFTQGVAGAIGASTLNITIDTTLGETPSFTQGFEVITFSAAPTADLNAPTTPYPVHFPLNRDAFSGTPFTFTDLGSGVWQVGGLTGPEITALTAVITPGTTNILVKGATDGPTWIRGVNCPDPSVVDTICRVSADSFVYNFLCVNESHINTRIEPRPGSTAWACAMRGGLNLFSAAGTVTVRGGWMFGTGDDPIAVQGASINQATWISTTSFLGFTDANFYSALPRGSKFICYDASNVQQATGIITDYSVLNGTFKRTYTVDITSGSLPVDLTGCNFPITDYQPVSMVTNNTVQNIRGRGVWYSGPGVVSGNIIENITDPGIEARPQVNGDAEFSGGRDPIIAFNTVRNSCVETFYGGAIVAWAAPPSDSTKVALNTPYVNLQIFGNIIDGANGVAILTAGVKGANVYGNMIANVSSTLPGQLSGQLGIAAATVFLIVNCTNASFKLNHLRSINSIAISTQTTNNGGSNTNNLVDQNLNFDTSPVIQGFATKLGAGTTTPTEQLHVKNSGVNVTALIETNGGFNPILRLKSNLADWDILPNAGGLFFLDNAGPTVRLTIDQNGKLTIAGALLNIATFKTPSSAGDTGVKGDFGFDASFGYMCVATNTWKRFAIATW